MAEVDFGINTTTRLSGPPLSYLILQDIFEKPGPTGLDRETRLKQQMLDSVFTSPYETGYATNAGPLLIAWLDQSPTAIQVEGTNVRNLGTSLVIARPALRFGDRDVSVPSGFVPARLIDQAGGASPCYGRQGNGFAFYQGSITLEFRLPPELYHPTSSEGASGGISDQRIDFSQLSLIIQSDGGLQQPPATALYDWEAGSWQQLEDIRPGANRIDSPDRYIDPSTHAIRLRMQAANDQGGCVYTDIALEGTHGSAVSDQ